MGIVLNTLSTFAIVTDPTASMMMEIKKEIMLNLLPYNREEEKVIYSDDILNINSINIPLLSISPTSLDASLFNIEVNNNDINCPTVIIKEALNQIKNLNYIEVDDKIDREIDAFFAKRESRKVKKLIYKRR